MWIARDIEAGWSAPHGMPVQIVRGMRQCGKSSLLLRLSAPGRGYATLDDLQARQIAAADPALFFLQHPPPVTVDEVQYAPPLFPEIKRLVDSERAGRLAGVQGSRAQGSRAQGSRAQGSRAQGSRAQGSGAPFWLTGSNQILMDRHVRESLAGRAVRFTLHTLSVGELTRGVAEFAVTDALVRGGWPELYTNAAVDPVRYLNDYVSAFLEKDIALSAGIEKLQSFRKALGLMAARTARPFNASEIAGHCGVSSVTIQDWAGLLERNLALFLLPGYHSNLNKRLVKSPKLYFLDCGLAARLQGWSEAGPLLVSPQAGLLFETLVLSEIVKTRDHFQRDWTLCYWRTKEGDEIDFLALDAAGRCVALEAKLGVQSAGPVEIKRRPGLPDVAQYAVVTPAGERQALSRESVRIPVTGLADYLLETLG